jgi:hypothetical protein
MLDLKMVFFCSLSFVPLSPREFFTLPFIDSRGGSKSTENPRGALEEKVGRAL